MTVEEAPCQVDSEALFELGNLTVEQSRFRKVLAFFLSLGLFLLLGLLAIEVVEALTLRHLLIVTIVLFIHECGHYAGMRFFGYRNLKMFFIPLFGAAVTGYGCVSRGKEGIIYLLGPVPGLLIGYCCYGIHLLTGSMPWLTAAELFVYINALNLLPVYPLDGGRCLLLVLPRSVLRSQTYIQMLLFVMALVLTSGLKVPYFSGFVSGIAGIFGAGLTHLHRKIKIVSVLDSKMETCPAGGKHIPKSTAEALIGEIRRDPYYSKPKEMARMAWEVWVDIQGHRCSRKRDGIILLAVYILSWGFVITFYQVYASTPTRL